MYLKQKNMDLSFTPKEVHGLFMPSATVILLGTEKQEEVFMGTLYIFVGYALHGKQRNEKCGTINYRS